MKLLISLIVFSLGFAVAADSGTDARTKSRAAACEARIAGIKTFDSDLANLKLIFNDFKINGFGELTRQALGTESVHLIHVEDESGLPSVDVEIPLRGPYRFKYSNIDRADQRSVWAVANGLAKVEVDARVRQFPPLIEGRRPPWRERPTATGHFRSESVPHVINSVYGLLMTLDQIDPTHSLPERDPALKFKMLRAVVFGSPRTQANRGDFERDYIPEGRGDESIKSMLYERYFQEMRMAAVRQQVLAAGLQVAKYAAVSAPLLYYGYSQMPASAPPPPPVNSQRTNVVEPPSDPREKKRVIKHYQELIEEHQRRKALSLRNPDTDYINEAKQAVIDYQNDYFWLVYDKDAPPAPPL